MHSRGSTSPCATVNTVLPDTWCLTVLQNHYEMSSVFAAKEYDNYFMRLPANLRNELATEICYVVRTRTIACFVAARC